MNFSKGNNSHEWWNGTRGAVPRISQAYKTTERHSRDDDGDVRRGDRKRSVRFISCLSEKMHFIIINSFAGKMASDARRRSVIMYYVP